MSHRLVASKPWSAIQNGTDFAGTATSTLTALLT